MLKIQVLRNTFCNWIFLHSFDKYWLTLTIIHGQWWIIKYNTTLVKYSFIFYHSKWQKHSIFIGNVFFPLWKFVGYPQNTINRKAKFTDNFWILISTPPPPPPPLASRKLSRFTIYYIINLILMDLNLHSILFPVSYHPKMSPANTLVLTIFSHFFPTKNNMTILFFTNKGEGINCHIRWTL